MWHLTHIPQQAHFYWGGGALSYLRYLSLTSFKRHNPGWQITLHVPKIPCTRPPAWHTHQQKNVNIKRDFLDRIDVAIESHDFRDYGFDNDAHEVHKSDFLRWKLLGERGGVWSDIDILYLRGLQHLPDNCAGNHDRDTVLCPLIPPMKHTVGFLMSSSHNAFFQNMMHTSLERYDPMVYQCMGSDILNDLFRDQQGVHDRFPENQWLWLDPQAVYAIAAKEIDLFFRPLDAHTQKKLTSPRVIGFHWFAGHPRSQQYENDMNPGRVSRTSNFIDIIVERALI